VRTATYEHSTDTGISTQAAIAIAITRADPGAAVVTSNQASVSTRAAVTAAVRLQ
jgi:hypothetical protein